MFASSKLNCGHSGQKIVYKFYWKIELDLVEFVQILVSPLQVVIDSELDMMLAKLEGDSNFNEMTENEQLTWLESLFYQSPTAFDTSSR